MSIYRNSCRQTERVTMKKLFAQGKSVTQISSALRVNPAIITDVIEGKWDDTEKALTKAAMLKNQEAITGKADAESNKIAQIAAAAAAAVSGQAQVVDPAALRKEIEAQVRAELEAEKDKPLELTSGQKGAATRKANAEKKAEAA
jgi:hypothetical protein